MSFTKFSGYRKAMNAARSIVPLFIRYTRSKPEWQTVSFDTPFAIGFLTIFITCVANQRVVALNQDSIGLIQAETLADILGCQAAMAGEAIAFESARSHPEFRLGCDEADLFCQQLFQAIDVGELEKLGKQRQTNLWQENECLLSFCYENSHREHLLDHWYCHFEQYLQA